MLHFLSHGCIPDSQLMTDCHSGLGIDWAVMLLWSIMLPDALGP